MTTPPLTTAPVEPGPDVAADGNAMPPMPFAPEPDNVTGPDSDIMHGLVLDYTYSAGRHYRLSFDHDHHVTFTMPDVPRPAGLPADAKPPLLKYRARELKPGLVLVHWIVKQAAIHVALTIDLDENKLHAAAMMPPNRWEFFDTAVIHTIPRDEPAGV